jgi:hypothetical protein
VVVVSHEAELHIVPSIDTVGDISSCAKLSPVSVSSPDGALGRFRGLISEIIGASNVKTELSVPMPPERVTATCLDGPLLVTRQANEVCEVHPEVIHNLRPN